MTDNSGFTLYVNHHAVLSHTSEFPLLYVGIRKESIEEYRGNYAIEDHVEIRNPLRKLTVTERPNEIGLDFKGKVKGNLTVDENRAVLSLTSCCPHVNRVWIRVRSNAEEKVYGCGEQFSYFNLKGKHFLLWSSEPGVGRNKNTYLTRRCDVESRSGGDYYNTYFPQTTYLSNRKYYFHADTTAYADFDFRNEGYHELQFWEMPRQIRIEEADTFPELRERLTDFLGRPPELPDWVYQELIMGVQGGTERVFHLLEQTQSHEIPVAGVWCQDWEGVKTTSFGKRLHWNWTWDRMRYPNLPGKIDELKKAGIRFLGYINPYLLREGNFCREAVEKEYLVKKLDGTDCFLDFGEFNCGIPDLTNPEAYQWYKELIKRELIGFGVGGWMADFGEYLPTDAVLSSGESAMTAHNLWPVLWAKCNYDALRETGRPGDIIYFMRQAESAFRNIARFYGRGTNRSTLRWMMASLLQYAPL